MYVPVIDQNLRKFQNFLGYIALCLLYIDKDDNLK